MNQVFIGIDPGVSGAVAILTPQGNQVFDTPVCDAVKGKEYLPHAMRELLADYSGAMAMLEVASAARTAGGGQITANGTLKIGHGSGLWEGLLVGLGIRYERPTPQAWKKALKLPVGADKDQSRARAMALYPELAGELKFKCNHGRADALLIATYGRLRWADDAKAERVAAPRRRKAGG